MFRSNLKCFVFPTRQRFDLNKISLKSLCLTVVFLIMKTRSFRAPSVAPIINTARHSCLRACKVNKTIATPPLVILRAVYNGSVTTEYINAETFFWATLPRSPFTRRRRFYFQFADQLDRLRSSQRGPRVLLGIPATIFNRFGTSKPLRVTSNIRVSQRSTNFDLLNRKSNMARINIGDKQKCKVSSGILI